MSNFFELPNLNLNKSKKSTLSIFLIFFLSINSFAQNSGDFRSSTVAGDWQTNSSWQTYNGTSWVAATSYPGQNAGAYDVTILTGHTIYIRTDFTSSTMGDVIVNGRLNVGWTRNLQITLNTPLLYLNGGDLGFLHQKTELYFPTNSVIQIENGGDIIGRCSNNTEIYIGGELTAVCRGGGGTVLTFGEVVAGGGTINSIITAPATSPYVSCGTQVINLTGMFGGAVTNVSYEWTVTDPTSVDVAISNSTGTLANNAATTTATSFTASIAGNYLVSLSVTDGANNFSNVETKVITVNEIPTITSTTPNSIIGTGTVTLGATASGGTLNWYANSSGGSSLGTGTSFTTPSISTTTTYYVDATLNGCTSPRIAVNASSYCSSNGNTTYETGITLVSFNTINNTDGPTKDVDYEDFTNISTDVTQDSSYDLTINLNTGAYRQGTWRHTGTAYSKVWIDWNQDGDFNDTQEEYNLGSLTYNSDGSTSNSPLSITIPSFASTGPTRMRVSAKYNSNPTSCETGFDGEVEDYTVNVLSSGPKPEINIVGNGNTINDGDVTPNTSDDTDFGSVDFSSGSVSHIFTIQNTGNSNLTLDDISPFVVITGDTSEFTLTTNPTTPISGGSSTTFAITFNPTSVGVKTATISILNNDGNEGTYNFNIQGTGTSPSFSEVIVSVNWPSWSSENRVEVYSPSGTLITTIDNGFNGASDNSYSTSVNLGCLEDLNNYYFIMYDTYGDGWNGSDNITITSSGVAVINQSDNNTASVAGSTVNFNVSGGVCGSEIDILGNGNSILDGDTTPSSTDNTDFGTALVTSGSVAHTFTIQNTGAVDLTLDNPSPYIVITGDTSEFTLTSNPTTPIASSGSTTFTITFDPTSAGTKNATISIANNDSNENPYNFSITGQGTVPVCSNTIITLPYTQDFESGTNGWNTGGSDAERVNNTTWSFSNNYSLQIRDNSGEASSFCSPVMSLNTYDKVDFKFFFSAYSMEDNEDFFIEYSSDDGSTWTIIDTFKSGQVADKECDFENTSSTIFYSKTSTILKTDYTFPVANEARFRVRCDASDDNDIIFIDDISIKGTTYTNPTNGPGGVISDLDLWLKADKVDGSTVAVDGSNLSKWVDNGKGNDAEVVITGQEPTYRNSVARNINFNPVVDFENDNTTASSDMTYLTSRDELKGTGGFNSNDMFVVIIPDPTITNSMLPLDTFTSKDPTGETYQEDVTGFGYGSFTQRLSGEYFTYCIGTSQESPPSSGTYTGFGRGDASGSNNYNQISIINVRHNSSNDDMELYLNANQVGTSTNDGGDFATITNTRYWLGRSQYWNGSFDGRIAEIITYSSTKSSGNLTQDRNRVQSYLGIKYGITLGTNGTSQDYVDSDGTVIWDQSVNNGYNFDIAGIGRDDASELNQKQSKSVNNASDGSGPTQGVLTIGLTDIYDTNSENITTNSANNLANKQFLVWGNNGIDLNFATSTIDVNMSSGISPALSTDVHFTGMQRVWKVVENGGDIPKVKIGLRKDAVRNITPPGSYLMFISDNGVFTPTSDYRIMTESSGNLYTEYDFDKTKYITFGYAPETVVERSIYFNGSADYIDMEDALDIDGSEFTISSWIKRESGSLNKSILSKRNVGYSEGYDFKINNSGKVEMSWGNSGTQKIISNTTIPENVWHQVAVIYDSGTAKIYIDGVLDKTVASLGNPSATSQSFFIAAAGKNTPEAFFKGNIDEVRVWDVALSENQLRYIMNQEIVDNSNFTNGTVIPNTITKNEIEVIPYSNLKGYYPMSVYTYTNTNDMSGNLNQGALRNLNTVDRQTAPLPYKSQASGNWDNSGTWLNNTVQPLPNSLSIVDGTTSIDWNVVETNHDINIDTYSNVGREVKVLGLMVNSNKLQINGSTSSVTGNGLNVSHYLKLDGTIDLEGESQLIQTTGSDLVVGASGRLERDQQGEGNKYRYNDWSSPVSSTSVNSTFKVVDVLKDGTNGGVDINFVGGYDGNNASNPIQIANFWIYAFRNRLNDDYSQWEQVGSTTDLKAGEGFLMKGTGSASDQNYVFKGVPNNGNITLSITGDNDYLVGNPYPSALDADQFLIDNAGNIEGTLYFWEHYGGDTHNLKDYQAGYASYNFSGSVAVPHPITDLSAGPGTKLPGRFIPIGQGFTIQGLGAGSKNVVFNNGQRAFQKEDVTNSIFMRTGRIKKKLVTTEVSTDLRPKFRIGFDVKGQGHRELLLTIDDRATEAIDWGFDGAVYDMLNDDMYWVIEEEKHVIQGTNNWNKAMEVPLGIITEEGGSFSISIDGLENVDENTSLFIKDLLTGETYDITNNPFEVHLGAGEYNDRYALTFQPRLKTLEEIELIKGVNIFMDNNSSELHVNKIVDTKLLEIELYNILGQNVRRFKGNYTDRNLVLPLNLNTGVYIVKILTSNGIISRKIIIE